jgi:sterol desaturase/sphingolipid hydroxylase (fatty acid hydroxylase superfamily)
MFPKVIEGIIVLAFIFVPLERLFTLHKQKILRRGWITDLTYFLIGHFVGKAGILVSGFIIFSLLNQLTIPALQNAIASQPIWAQFIATVIIADTAFYICHRLLHTVPWLWKFHAVHHSTLQMDWLATVRVHPLEQLVTKTCQIMPLYFLGFSAAALGVYALFSAAIAFFIHANINIKFGFLHWLIATPEFHHWHHADDPKAHDKNFAVQIPLLDLLFGTLYMPNGKMPDDYGIPDPVPTGYVQQVIYPLQRNISVGE